MTRSSIDRREFLRRAGMTAGTLGMAGGVAALPGCGNTTTGPRPPLAPTTLTAVAHSATRIDLSWTDNASDETSYEVERRLASDTEFALLATLTSDQVDFTDESVGEQVMYIYRVRAVAETLESEYSNEAEATTPAAGAPLAPLGLTVESVMPNGAVLTWTDAAINENGYRVERIDDAGVATILTLPRGAASALIDGLAADDIVRVHVIAFNEIGDSPPSAEVRFLTGAVAELIVLTPVEPGRLRVNWTDRTSGRLGFQLDRDAGSGFTPVTTLPAATRSFDDTTFPLGVTVTYRLSAVGTASIAPPMASLVIPGAPPAAPTNAAASLVSTSGSRIQIGWLHPGGDDVIGFAIERRIGTGAFSQLVILNDPQMTSHEDAPNADFVPVTYRVIAQRVINWNLAGASPPSNEVAITPRAVFFFTGNLAVLNTVNKGVAVTINRPSVSIGAACNATTSSVYLVRENETRIAAVVAHCTHACLRPPNFNWVESATRFRCAHGSEFNLAGQVLRGPAPSNVATLQTVLFSDRVELIPPTLML